MFACHTLKSGGPIRLFLSTVAWQPLSKLTLCIYLVHMPYILYSIRFYPYDSRFFWQIHLWMGDLCVSVSLATAAFIFIESPAGRVVDIFWRYQNQFMTKKTSTTAIREEKQHLLESKLIIETDHTLTKLV
jgi:peptidoglycan/LPS O-acetylase OafA/YrhL